MKIPYIKWLLAIDYVTQFTRSNRFIFIFIYFVKPNYVLWKT